MGKKLFISGIIILFLAGFTFVGAFLGTVLFAKLNPIQVAQPVAFMPVDRSLLPVSENLRSFPADLDRQLSQLQEEVMGVRQLLPDDTIFRNTLSPAELRERVVTDFFGDYSDEELHRDTILYTILGAVEPDFDLYNFIIDLYSEQIAGFYDDETKEMVVVQGGDFGGPERMTYAHEFTHLLQDQNYDFEDGLNLSQELLDRDMDAYAAIQALVEGDAVMTEYLWYQDFATQNDNLDVQQFSLELSTPVYDQAPAFIKNELLFPYQYGLEFVHGIYAQQGWAGVAKLYENPPLSTEQILHPERYPEDKPIAVSLDVVESAIPSGWRKLHESTFGEAYLYLLLTSGEGEPVADVSLLWEAVKGWGGDRYQLYLNDENEEIIFVLKTVWDTENDAEQFSEEFISYAAVRWPAGKRLGSDRFLAADPHFQFMSFERQGVETFWFFAPDETTLDALKAVLAGE